MEEESLWDYDLPISDEITAVGKMAYLMHFEHCRKGDATIAHEYLEKAKRHIYHPAMALAVYYCNGGFLGYQSYDEHRCWDTRLRKHTQTHHPATWLLVHEDYLLAYPEYPPEITEYLKQFDSKCANDSFDLIVSKGGDDPVRYYAIAMAVDQNFVFLFPHISAIEPVQNPLVWPLMKQGAKEGCILCQQWICMNLPTARQYHSLPLAMNCYSILTLLESINPSDRAEAVQPPPLREWDLPEHTRALYNANEALVCLLACSKFKERSEDPLFKKIPYDVVRMIAEYVHWSSRDDEWAWNPPIKPWDCFYFFFWKEIRSGKSK